MAKWMVVFFVFLSFSTSVMAGVFVNEGESNGPLISTGVIETLTVNEKVPVLIKLRDEGDNPFTSRMTTSLDPARFISKEDIKRLQRKFESDRSREGLQNEIQIIHRMDNIPWITGTITQRALKWLQTNPNVAMITEDKPVKALLAESGPLINSNDAHNLGFTGSGVTVAVLDTGIDTNHPNPVDDLVHEECFLSDGSCPGGGTRCSGPGCAEDGDGHGTHVSGIITSSHPTFKGIAPDAGIVAVKVLNDSGTGFKSDVIAGIDWVTTNKDAFGIKIINMSLGGSDFSGFCDNFEPPFAAACDAAKSAGITIFAASGNRALPSEISRPACLSSVISVGAVYDANIGPHFGGICTDPTTQADQIACFSNVSSILDILAPGCETTSAFPGGGTASRCGTSMSSPHAAGVATLMIQKDPSLTPNEIEGILKCNGVPIFDSRIGMSFPRIDALAALFPTVEAVDNDADGFNAPPCGEDCDDSNPTINPRAAEICNDGVDNDCDGLVDCDDPDCASGLRPTNYRGLSLIQFNPPRALPRDRALLRLCVDECFCEALMEGVEEISLTLNEGTLVTIPGSRLIRRGTIFTARSVRGERPGYSLKIGCGKGLWLKLRLWDAGLQYVLNPIETCAIINEDLWLCAETTFIERRDRRGRLTKLTLTVPTTCPQ